MNEDMVIGPDLEFDLQCAESYLEKCKERGFPDSVIQGLIDRVEVLRKAAAEAKLEDISYAQVVDSQKALPCEMPCQDIEATDEKE